MKAVLTFQSDEPNRFDRDAAVKIVRAWAKRWGLEPEEDLVDKPVGRDVSLCCRIESGTSDVIEVIRDLYGRCYDRDLVVQIHFEHECSAHADG